MIEIGELKPFKSRERTGGDGMRYHTQIIKSKQILIVLVL
jgi:hypothetical protein